MKRRRTPCGNSEVERKTLNTGIGHPISLIKRSNQHQNTKNNEKHQKVTNFNPQPQLGHRHLHHETPKKQPITIFGNGSQVRDFIHVNDTAEDTILAEKPSTIGKAINIGAGKPTTINH